MDLGFEMRINYFISENFEEISSINFRENPQFKELVQEEWPFILRILKQKYMVISYLNVFEKLVKLFRECLLNKLLDSETLILHNWTVVLFRAIGDFYDVRSLDYDKLVDDFVLVMNYLKNLFDDKPNPTQ